MSEPNPYQSPAVPPETPATAMQRRGEDALHFAARWHNIIGGLGLLGASIALVDAMAVILLYSNSASNLRPAGLFNVVTVAIMVPQCLLMLAGGISMHQHKRRWLAIAGAWAGISPFCGCYVFSLITGIWALLVLWRPEVKALFAARGISSDES